MRDPRYIPITVDGVLFEVFCDEEKNLGTLIDRRNHRVIATLKGVNDMTKYRISNEFKRVVRWFLSIPKEKQELRDQGFDLVVEKPKPVHFEDARSQKKPEGPVPAWKKGWVLDKK